MLPLHEKALASVSRADKAAMLAAAKTAGVSLEGVIDAIMSRPAPEGESAARLSALAVIGSTAIARVRATIGAAGGWPYTCGQCHRESVTALRTCVVCSRSGDLYCIRGDGCPGCDGDRAVAAATAATTAAAEQAALESAQRVTERAQGDAASAAAVALAANARPGKAGDAL